MAFTPSSELPLSAADPSSEHLPAQPIAAVPPEKPVTTPTSFEQWCMGQVLAGFRAMDRGRMVLTLPDQTVHCYGEVCENTPDAAMTINSWRFFTQLILFGHIGAGESYMAGDWDSPAVQRVVAWFIRNNESAFLLEGSPVKRWSANLFGLWNRWLHRTRHNSITGSDQNIRAHYDLGNDFFRLVLDPSMTYSSALFSHPEQSLTEAQIDKYEALCQKLRIHKSDHVLEIGSGWGGFACYAARRYGCRITGITLSPQQLAYAEQWAKHLGLQDKVKFVLRDYRHMSGQFDKIVSIEMIEAVGDRYYETYFRQCEQLLKPGGLLAIQAITCPDARYELLKNNVDFIQKHIFPGSLLPSLGRLTQATQRATRFSLVAMTDMGLSYAETLQRWDNHLHLHRDEILALRSPGDPAGPPPYDPAFIRQWHYYLMYCKAAFATRNITVVQLLYSAPNNGALSPPLESIL